MDRLYTHQPVLADEVAEQLVWNPSGVYVDGTLGGGGHAAALLDRLGPKGRLIGIDQDQTALDASRRRFSERGDRILIQQGNFRDIAEIIRNLGLHVVDGILVDLGVSSHQIDTPERGFSYMNDGPLDMRMNALTPVTAATLVNTASEKELESMIRSYGEERMARSIARRIVMTRDQKPIATTQELAGIVKASVHTPLWIKSCARVFQALRIAVNEELDSLRIFLDSSINIVSTGGRVGVIAYHSLEDRMVKQVFGLWTQNCVCPPNFPKCVCGHTAKAKWIVKKPVLPSESETTHNPRARSARFRMIERLNHAQTLPL